MNSLRNKFIALTGAAGGIGKAIAAQLAAQGATLLLIDRNELALKNLADSLGEQHIAVSVDLSSAEGLQAVTKCCAQLDNGLDMLINAAGINQFGAFESLSQDDINRLLNVNLQMQIQLTHALLPILKQQSAATIVNIGSTFGSIGFPGFAVYCATKFAMRGFSEALRRELADTSVMVKYFAPRATQTAINDDKVNAMNKALNTAMDTSEAVAEAFMEFLFKAKQSSAYLGWPEKLFVRINSILPGVVDKSLIKQLPIIKRFF
jgi:short-subunit dehydrogenase